MIKDVWERNAPKVISYVLQIFGYSSKLEVDHGFNQINSINDNMAQREKGVCLICYFTKDNAENISLVFDFTQSQRWMLQIFVIGFWWIALKWNCGLLPEWTLFSLWKIKTRTTVTLPTTNISLTKALWKIMFLFLKSDMQVPWRVWFWLVLYPLMAIAKIAFEAL